MDFDDKMDWAESEIDKGNSNSAEPCAKPGCSPFPTCCTTVMNYSDESSQ